MGLLNDIKNVLSERSPIFDGLLKGYIEQQDNLKEKSTFNLKEKQFLNSLDSAFSEISIEGNKILLNGKFIGKFKQIRNNKIIFAILTEYGETFGALLKTFDSDINAKVYLGDKEDL